MTDKLNSKGWGGRVLLIGWDAADWQTIDPLMAAGQMPNLKRFVDEGLRGNIASLSPMLSPMLWTSIATGKLADKHDILGFCEPDGSTGKIRPVTSTSRKCKALWNIVSDAGLRAGVINWYASHPAEKINGTVVTDRYAQATAPPDKPWPAIQRSVHPESMLETLCDLRLHPAETTAEQLAAFIPNIGKIDAVRSAKVAELRTLLAHCATVHAAATHLVEQSEWDFLGVYYDAIDRFAHTFMEFHPPQAEHVSDEDFELYRDVVEGCYRFHDMMLGRLMNLAGEETTVIIVSDHGFHSGKLRPTGTSNIKDGQPVSWHRPYGVVAMWGPGLKKGERIYGASLLDIAPTVLSLLGLPVGEDMDGTALTQIFHEPPVLPDPVQTHEDPTASADPEAEEDPWVAAQMLAQLRRLGYIGDDSTEDVHVDRIQNLGQVYLTTGRPRLAMEQFKLMLELKPDDRGARMMIATCCMQMGQLDECEKIAREVHSEEGDAPRASLYMGMIAFQRGETDKALLHLREAERTGGNIPGLQTQFGQVFLRAGQWDEAERSFSAAIEMDPDDADAHDGLGVAARMLKRPEDAVFSHTMSIGLLHHRPQSHINLGLALAESGRIGWAIRAFEVAAGMGPANPLPHECLGELHERATGSEEKAGFHKAKAAALQAAIVERRAQRPGV